MLSAGIAITALSGCNALGSSVAEIEARLFAGESGLVAAPGWIGVATVVGAVPHPPAAIPSAWAADDSLQARMCVAALSELLPAVARACERWSPERVAIVVGTSTGGVAESERANFYFHEHGVLPADYNVERQHGLQATLRICRLLTGCKGPSYVVSTACSSSAKVFATAHRMIRTGLVDAVVAGGVDTLCRLTVRGFASLEVLSSVPCRPMSSLRAGINIGEGGAFLLLERDGPAFARLLAVGESSDAHHMTAPHPDGEGALSAMRAALESAGVSPAQVDHVNAHATATLQNDRAEALAITRLCGSGMALVANKGAVGHLLGAAGATELLFSALAIKRRERPPSHGCEPVDGSLAVDVSARARPMERSYILSNSLAFGGSNVSVLLGGHA